MSCFDFFLAKEELYANGFASFGLTNVDFYYWIENVDRYMFFYNWEADLYC